MVINQQVTIWKNPENVFGTSKPDSLLVISIIAHFVVRLLLTQSGRYVSASVVHFENGEVISANTREWALKEQLYKTNDTCAYINLGRVLAQRCLESGLLEIQSFIETTVENGKVAAFLKAMEDCGVCLKEPEQYKHPNAWDKLRPEKPWEVIEEK